MITADGSAGDMMPVGEIMAAGDGNTGDGEEDLSIEASLFYTILEEKQPASPSGEGDIFVENLQGEPVMDTGNGGIWHLQSGSQMIEGADGGDESVGYAVNSIHNLEGSDARVGYLGGSFDYAEKQMSSSMHACSGNHARDLNLNLLLDENGNQLRHVEGNVEFIDASHGSWIDSSDEKFGSGDALV
ncbi:hypothetical protein OIU78_024634 [Salix suchowensis]|nr:hypothetical protein OIU78_024634 [Salix suchowensis]